MARVVADPAGVYGSDPDYEDWANSPFDKALVQNKGTAYEGALYSNYRDRGMTPVGFTPAGSDATAADLELWLPNYTGPGKTNGCKRAKIEVKLDFNVDFGQSSLKHDGGAWKLTGSQDGASIEMRRLLNRMNVPAEVGKVWKGQPNLFKYANSSKVPGNEKQADLQNYPSSYLFDDSYLRTFASYYKEKKVYYIQIGGAGLYYLGEDPNGLKYVGAKNIFGINASMKLRIRTKGSASKGTYRFSTALLIDRLPTITSALHLDRASDMNMLHGDAIWACNNVPSLVNQRV